MSPDVLFLLLGGFLCLIGLGVTGLWLAGDQKKRRLWAARREAAIGPYLAPKKAEAPVLALGLRPAPTTQRFSLLTSVLSWREERRAQYPMSWTGVLLCMAGPAAIVGLLATKLLGPSGWLLFPAALVLLTRMMLTWMIQRVSRTLLSQFPDALSMVARSVRVGVPVSEAIRIVAREAQTPTREEFARAADQMQIGVALETALNEMAEKNDLPEYRFFATALTLQAQTGGGLTETLDILADTIRKREAARKRGVALASEARTSIYVLVALPIVVGAMLFVMNPDYVSLLFTDPTGEKLLAAGAGLLVAGLAAMQQIIKSSLS